MSRYLFDELELDREIITLLSIVNASEKNHALLDPYFEKDKGWAGIFYSEWTLIQNYIISLAIKIRIIDDLFIKNRQTYELPFNTVGSIIGKDKVDKPLQFREACNKVAHSVDFQPETKRTRNDPEALALYAYYLPSIKIVGEKRGNYWEATIDLHKFLFSALALAEEYDGNRDLNTRNDFKF